MRNQFILFIYKSLNFWLRCRDALFCSLSRCLPHYFSFFFFFGFSDFLHLYCSFFYHLFHQKKGSTKCTKIYRDKIFRFFMFSLCWNWRYSFTSLIVSLALAEIWGGLVLLNLLLLYIFLSGFFGPVLVLK